MLSGRATYWLSVCLSGMSPDNPLCRERGKGICACGKLLCQTSNHHPTLFALVRSWPHLDCMEQADVTLTRELEWELALTPHCVEQAKLREL
eukprot:1161864-Pelagomonas_calceolata.AAC.3